MNPSEKAIPNVHTAVAQEGEKKEGQQGYILTARHRQERPNWLGVLVAGVWEVGV